MEMLTHNEDICIRREELKTNSERINRVRACMLDDSDAMKLSEVFKILGDQTRIKIIFALSCCELCVCDIAETIFP
jgi:hypothetical protein